MHSPSVLTEQQVEIVMSMAALDGGSAVPRVVPADLHARAGEVHEVAAYRPEA